MTARVVYIVSLGNDFHFCYSITLRHDQICICIIGLWGLQVLEPPFSHLWLLGCRVLGQIRTVWGIGHFGFVAWGLGV